jgi:hypothetical protein
LGQGAKVVEIAAQPAKVLFQLFIKGFCFLHQHFCEALHASGPQRKLEGLHQIGLLAAANCMLYNQVE